MKRTFLNVVVLCSVLGMTTVLSSGAAPAYALSPPPVVKSSFNLGCRPCEPDEGEGEQVSTAYNIGKTRITFRDPARKCKKIPTRIYYPADKDGRNVPLASGDTKFPVIVFGHGYLIPWNKYDYIYQAFVKNGYIVAFPQTGDELFPDHEDFGRDLAFVVDSLFAEGATCGSVFYERVAQASAVMGHSMGGGAAFLATGYSSNITTVVTLAPAETRPSAIVAAGGVLAPVLIFAGGKDEVTPPESNQIPMYDAVPWPRKYLVTIVEASHCGFAECSFTCSIGELFVCACCSFLDKGIQQDTVISLALPWLNYHLKDIASEETTFLDALNAEISSGLITAQGACP